MTLRKTFALVLALVMAFSMTAAVLADDSGLTGDGTFEGYVDKSILTIKYPTQTAFEFIADPQGLIEASEAGRFDGLSSSAFTSETGMYFKNVTAGSAGTKKTMQVDVDGAGEQPYDVYADEDDVEYIKVGDDWYVAAATVTTGSPASPNGTPELVMENVSPATTTYEDTSEDFVIVNKSVAKVDVTVTAKMTGIEGVTMAATKEAAMAEDAPASMYIKIAQEVSGDANEKVLTAEAAGVTLTGQIAKADETLFKVEYVAPSGTQGQDDYVAGYYKFGLADPATADTEFENFTFNFTGAAGGDWSKVTGVDPTMELTWTAVAHSDDKAPSAEASYPLTAGEENVITINTGAGTLKATKVNAAKFKNAKGNEYTTWADYATLDLATGKMTIAADTVTALLSNAPLTITYEFDTGTVSFQLVAE